MNFVFISPTFPDCYYQFCQELKNCGVNVFGIAEDWYIKPELENALTEYYRVDSLKDYNQVYKAVAYFSWKYGKIDYIESNNEFWLEQDARLRSDFNVTTGKKAEEINFFKSKEAMKTCYKKAKCPVARYIIPTTYEKGLEFINEVGYPVIVKPDNGVGAYDTYKIHNEEELKKFYFENFPSVKYIMEEFIQGDLISFDGIVDSNCNPVFFSNEVYPLPIMEVVNRGEDCFYYVNKGVPADLEKVGRRVLKAFGAKSRFFHLEFFRLTKAKAGLGEVGDIIGLEVNMRCPGGYTPDMINFGHSVSSYRIWAQVMTFDRTFENLDGKDFYCCYMGRRDNLQYEHSTDDIKQKYGDRLVMCKRNPDVLSGAMGSNFYVVILDTLEEALEFEQYTRHM